jgi:hypothetical protein
LCIDYIYAASADLKRRKTEEQKGDRGKTRRNKEGFSLILKSLHWNVKEERRKKEGEKDRQTATKKTRKSKRTQTPQAHHSFSVIVFVRQEARWSCFLVFCFISYKIESTGVSSLVLQLREL